MFRFNQRAERLIRLAAPFGFYGWGNIGDEATLAGFAALLKTSEVSLFAWIGSRNWRHTTKVEPAFHYFSAGGLDPRRWWAKRTADVQAVVGGTPVMDVLGEWPLCDVARLVCNAVEKRRVPFVCVGVGIEGLRSPESIRIVREVLAPRVLHWSVRTKRDRDRLVGYGVGTDQVTVAADMAWLIEPADQEFGRQQFKKWGLDQVPVVIGINLVNENAVLDRHPAMADAIAGALDRWVEDFDARLLFLANEVRDGDGFDTAAAQRIIARLKHPEHAFLAPVEYLAPREMMSIVRCCRFTLSMRYHFCIFSALEGVPFVAIERADKVSDLCWDLNWEYRVVPPDIVMEDLFQKGKAAIMNREALADRLHAEAAKMRIRAKLNLTPLQMVGIKGEEIVDSI
ncbi:hypothetical protein AYO49_01030 [Verrucomicrobiaceae bacterium SCGC AG-212-N21]|nr:hypothetical protein AYO49_01030 [Verrucomicrobiaceae bacterium SCGC AG-212-N21]